jgi:hypothetical protein
MDAQTITKLAKAHATLILQYTGVSQSEAISIASQIIQFIAGGGVGVGEPATLPSHQPQVTPQAPSDGVKDSPGEGAILAQPGYECYCTACKSTVYEVITPIRGKGMGVNAFCQAFRPIGHAAVLNRDNLEVIKDPEGNTYIDCPLCQGKKTLKLLGTKSAQKPVGIAAPVGSISMGEAGV